MPNLPEHLVPEEFAGNEWFVEEQYERYQKDKNLVDPSWWPIFETIDKALGGAVPLVQLLLRHPPHRLHL